jgi:hypothetical protein
MNWLQILLIHLLLAALSIYFLSRQKGELEDWRINLIMPIIIGTICFLPGYGALHDIETNHGKEVFYQSEVISLENSSGVAGSVSGGGFLINSFSGQLNGATNCAFIVKSEGNIEIITQNANKIIFHESADDESFAQLHYKVVSYPYRIKGKERFWDKTDYVWHIWIPANEMKRYIKFN